MPCMHVCTQQNKNYMTCIHDACSYIGGWGGGISSTDQVSVCICLLYIARCKINIYFLLQHMKVL